VREIQKIIHVNRLSYAVSLALASLVASNAAYAQSAAPGSAPQAGSPGDTQAASPAATNVQVNNANAATGAMATVLVSTRRSQQSAIERKKNAATAMDSIVAEDVGSLPDRNIGEAISRMAGVSLERGDFGEGVNVAVRGNGPELTRVELDGQAVLSAGGSDMSGTNSGRGTEFRQLSADLIKSVDVVKGSTADMTEGSLGGGIVIKTRTGLDFKKPFASLRVAGQQSNLNEKWTPDTNLILADKFLNNRLGVLVNASSTTMRNESHAMQVATSGTQGYARALDFDNSPDKTWTANPGTLNMADPAVNLPTGTAGTWKGATPLDILNKSAAAKTKQDCYAAFPVLTQTAPELGALSTNNKNNAVNIRGNELLSCLNQWNDYTPSLVRNIIKREVDKRNNLDLRTDFKVNSELTVYAKGSYNKRKVDNNTLTYGLGGLNTNTAGTYTDDANGVRTAKPGSGYYNYAIPSWRSGTYPSSATVANVDPASVKVDGNHHVTEYTITDGVANTDQIHMTSETVTKYLQLGGSFRRGGLTAEFFVGDAESKFQRGDARTSFNYNYGAATMSVLPTGLWTYAFPQGSNFNQTDAANYAGVKPATDPIKAVAQATPFIPKSPAYTVAQQPLTTQAAQVTWTPRIAETGERTAKLDLTYATPESIPFFTRFKAGFNLRDTTADQWGSNGGLVVKTGTGNIGDANYVAPVTVPRSIVRSFLQGCVNTPTSTGSPVGCTLGFKPNIDARTGSEGTMFVTPQQFQDIVAQSLNGNATATKFFNGAKGRTDNMIDNWTQIDVDKFLALSGVPGLNYDCVKSCTGTDGNVYEQPVTRLKERTQAVYLMGDFNLDHVPLTNWTFPFGLALEGNAGYRYIKTQVHGTGSMTFTSIAPTATYDPQNPNAGGTVSSSFTQNTAIDQKTHDFLPIYNLAMWVVPDQVVLRYNHAKTVARPPVSQLLPSGTCIYDQTLVDEEQRCTGTLGNPALMAQRNVNQNLSLEYYPNKDTMFTVAAFQQKGIVGPAITQGVSGVPFFAGSSQIDPATNTPLSSLLFDYSTYLNGAATTRKGLEFSTKTAFTFLPWFLRYTGFDANYSKLRSATSSLNVVDLLSGDPLPPQRESKYSYNWALWYDDGRLSARVAVQSVASYFNFIAANGVSTVNNWPNAGGGRTTVIPYNPGFPDYKDSTRFIDAKIAYKVTPQLEVFAEGRNLGNATTSNSQGSYGGFEDGTRSLLDYAYSGRRIMVGLNFRYGG
jgi:TonB-dependent receptor